MSDIETLLGEIGDLLLLDDDHLVTDVLAVIDQPRPSRHRRPALLWAAAIVAVVAAGIVAIVPSTRSAVADWFGLDRVQINRRSDVDLAPPSSSTVSVVSTSSAEPAPSEIATIPTTTDPTPTTSSPTTSSPIGETVELVDGTTVLISSFDGSLTEVLITKTVSGAADVVRVEIDGDPALWIPEAHEVLIERGGEPVVERVAANTLLWQEGDRLWRIEGFLRLEDALRFARSR